VSVLSSSSWNLDDGPNCEPHSNGNSSSRRTFPYWSRKFCDVCHRGADSRPVTLSASNRGSSSNDQASISTSQAISGAFGRGTVSGCRRQPRYVRVRRQAGCSVSFGRRAVGGQGHLRSHRAGPHARCRSNRPDAYLRLRKPPSGCGRGAADGAMTSAGASLSATSGESRPPVRSAESKRSISAKPARSRRK
jgi:hypothetical protein